MNQRADSNSTTTVLGATGKTGRRIAERLEGKGVAVRRASRSSEAAFDWDDRDTWAPAVAGSTALYISYQPDLIVARALDDVAEIAALAQSHGVGRLVLLAGRGEPEALAAGAAVHETSMVTTVLSCAWFDQNFDEGAFADEIATGSLTVPVGAVGEPFIDADDIADVAVEVLTGDPTRHDGATYELSGPRLLTFAEAAGEIGTAIGRPVEFTSVSLDDYRAILAQVGVPEPEVELFTKLFGTLFDGRNAHVSDGVEQVLGRPPRDFGEYVRRAAGSGAWSPSAAGVNR
ncbi:hypothetical protein GOARA_082_00720 [Gordonia araii NBRC 100433]|uniref:NAD(P)-binding domain-containing protein n=1 Tax=Gordonia araii NBRC 100433 TaxID=1073574 RepID=G7H758_9ACTN|nr:hypothetical protein [Gordonia araii]NNG97679.1 NmrA family transcriptional regulator [Gordonia araii NBRC 100433]GAB11683.1 hypothetical protein GOARA_082_00720 [Gordonia araii NBRC 100433]